MSYILQTKGLTKIYSHTKVVDNVSLTLNDGDIYGFVGKNGAGKTTFIRMLLGLSRADEGSFDFFDGEPFETARRRIGSLVEAPSIYKNMSARDNLLMYCTMLRVDKKCIDELLETVGLSDAGKKKAANFSLGMKQRLGIAMSLVGDPDLLILDEPINGLDPKGIVEIRELLLSLKKRGKTIFVSSHYLGELEKVATRYGIISSGRLVEELTREELTEKCGSRTIIKTGDPEQALKALKIVKDILKDDDVTAEKRKVIIGREIDDVGAITNELFKAGITVKGFSNDDNSAEEYFIKKMEE
ncbi:MAG: ABC transporter ATP-binding protein [Clostridia bacterium]|nr:ABC transporter ATP-binding protein [Clostridia bacterium]